MARTRRPSVSIALTPAQVAEVLRAASEGHKPSVSVLIAGSQCSQAKQGPAGGATFQESDAKLSQSLLRGLSILTSFHPDRRERGIVELAGELGMSPSTAHRYANTLLELGLLERCPATRKYRLPDA